jgi:hypothetical protein
VVAWGNEWSSQGTGRLPSRSGRGWRLAYFVREAFPSVATSTELTEGSLSGEQVLGVTSRMEDGVIFGDGMEADHLAFPWGAKALLRIADRRLRLVR